jgi:fructokinase
VLGPFRRLSVPLGFATDVSTAAYGEFVYGRHGPDVRHCAYVTVGTGIGAGLVLDGRVHTGLLHPEAGHMPARRHPRDVERSFLGICPFHTGAENACLEGLASANACAARLGLQVEALADLPDEHEVWEIEAFYLAQLCVNLTLTVSPQVIVLGGGVLKRGDALLTSVRRHFLQQLNGYLVVPRLDESTYITRSRFDAEGSGTSAGCVGTLAYAKCTLEKQPSATKQLA